MPRTRLVIRLSSSCGGVARHVHRVLIQIGGCALLAGGFNEEVPFAARLLMVLHADVRHDAPGALCAEHNRPDAVTI